MKSFHVLAVALTAWLFASVVIAVPASAQLAPTCNGLVATIVGTDGDDTIFGTWQDDVIAMVNQARM